MEQLISKFHREDLSNYGPTAKPWAGPWVEGGMPDGSGSVFVQFAPDFPFTIRATL
jgi:hypothetical protein